MSTLPALHILTAASMTRRQHKTRLDETIPSSNVERSTLNGCLWMQKIMLMDFYNDARDGINLNKSSLRLRCWVVRGVSKISKVRVQIPLGMQRFFKNKLRLELKQFWSAQKDPSWLQVLFLRWPDQKIFRSMWHCMTNFSTRVQGHI